MIISHKNNFIFIKTYKTAGTSIEIGLSKFCGKNDVITPVRGNIGKPDEDIRKEFGGMAPRNHKVKYFKNHAHAKEIRVGLRDEKLGKQYFKFAFVRNPYDRVISMYYFNVKKNGFKGSIKQFLQKHKGNTLYKFVTDNKRKIAVDKIYKYENLYESLEDIKKRLNFKGDIILPNAKTTIRDDKRHFDEILNDRDKERVYGLYKEDFELFGYEK